MAGRTPRSRDLPGPTGREPCLLIRPSSAPVASGRAGLAGMVPVRAVHPAISIGVDTALGVALESIDRLKVTAASHRRASVIEVMGRDCGYLALMAGIAGGAEAIVIPEAPASVDAVRTRSFSAAYFVSVVESSAPCCLLWMVLAPMIVNTTRRFCARPSLVLLSAIGTVSPNPLGWSRALAMPFLTR